MTLKEAYRILGVSKENTDREIRAKYKKLLIMYTLKQIHKLSALQLVGRAAMSQSAKGRAEQITSLNSAYLKTE